jgi:trehalose-phosphatase
MSRPIEEVCDILLAAHRRGQALVLLFDYDGTLTRLVAHPRLARLSPRMRAVLQSLAKQSLVVVGVISGRHLPDLRHMVGIPGLYYAGTNGLELDFRGIQRSHPLSEEGRMVVAQLTRDLRSVAKKYPGAWVEDKAFGMTLHYREVATHLVRELCCEARLAFRPRSAEWRVLDAPFAIEATLALSWSKASAVRMITTDVCEVACPLYAGDDDSDREAFETANSLGGVSLGVGPRAISTARYHLPAPGAIERLLVRLLSSLDLPNRADGAVPLKIERH